MNNLILTILTHFFIKEDTMAVIYVALIVKGKKTFNQVPDTLKPQVKEMLEDLELGYLAD